MDDFDLVDELGCLEDFNDYGALGIDQDLPDENEFAADFERTLIDRLQVDTSW